MPYRVTEWFDLILPAPLILENYVFSHSLWSGDYVCHILWGVRTMFVTLCVKWGLYLSHSVGSGDYVYHTLWGVGTHSVHHSVWEVCLSSKEPFLRWGWGIQVIFRIYKEGSAHKTLLSYVKHVRSCTVGIVFITLCYMKMYLDPLDLISTESVNLIFPKTAALF